VSNTDVTRHWDTFIDISKKKTSENVYAARQYTYLDFREVIKFYFLTIWIAHRPQWICFFFIFNFLFKVQWCCIFSSPVCFCSSCCIALSVPPVICWWLYLKSSVRNSTRPHSLHIVNMQSGGGVTFDGKIRITVLYFLCQTNPTKKMCSENIAVFESWKSSERILIHTICHHEGGGGRSWNKLSW